jgi:peptidoglycan/xylan/chitin deacetylase (PgdA/CDA1 family)
VGSNPAGDTTFEAKRSSGGAEEAPLTANTPARFPIRERESRWDRQPNGTPKPMMATAGASGTVESPRLARPAQDRNDVHRRAAVRLTYLRTALRCCAVSVMLACFTGCANMRGESTVPGTIIAGTDDFLIVRPTATASYEALAKSFMGDASLATVLTDLNGSGPPSASQLVVVPLHPLNASAVYADGYQTVPILAYHQFTRRKPSSLMEMTDDSFQRQMDYLKTNGYRVITLSELEGFLNAERPIPKRSVVITIDDGYRSVYDIAYPILKANGFSATLFVYTDFVGAGLALNWNQIKEMNDSGVIDIQSHSKSHTSLSRAPNETDGGVYAARVAREITVPESLLGQRLNKHIGQYAYPYGDSSNTVVSALQQRHYGAAVTVWRGGNASFANILMLKRDMVYSDYSLEAFKKLLNVHQAIDLR